MNKNTKVIIIAIILIMVSILLLLFLPNDTILSSVYREEDNNYLSCNYTGRVEYPLFDNGSVEDVDLEININFSQDTIRNLNIRISKVFNDYGSAKSFVDELHGNYYIYIGSHDISRERLTPSYNYVDGDIGRMTIFLDGDYLNQRTAPLVMLDDKIIDVNNELLINYTSYFTERGFICNES